MRKARVSRSAAARSARRGNPSRPYLVGALDAPDVGALPADVAGLAVVVPVLLLKELKGTMLFDGAGASRACPAPLCSPAADTHLETQAGLVRRRLLLLLG